MPNIKLLLKEIDVISDIFSSGPYKSVNEMFSMNKHVNLYRDS